MHDDAKDTSEVTDPMIALDPQAQTRTALLLLLDGQREVVPVAREAIAARIAADERRAEAWGSLRDALRSRWGSVGVLVVCMSCSLVLLSWAGIHVDLSYLATASWRAWRGECVPMEAPALPASDGGGGFMGPEVEPR